MLEQKGMRRRHEAVCPAELSGLAAAREHLGPLTKVTHVVRMAASASTSDGRGQPSAPGLQWRWKREKQLRLLVIWGCLTSHSTLGSRNAVVRTFRRLKYSSRCRPFRVGHSGRSDLRVGKKIFRFFTRGVRGAAGGLKPL